MVTPSPLPLPLPLTAKAKINSKKARRNSLPAYNEHMPEDVKVNLLEFGGMTGEPFLILSSRRWTTKYIEYLPADIIKRTLLEEAAKREARKIKMMKKDVVIDML